MNCGVCVAHLRDRRKCPGCRGGDGKKSRSCIRCFIRNCEILYVNGWRRCSEKCVEFPCDRLKGLDNRYKTKYNMGMIENLMNIGTLGVRGFIRDEEKRWIKGKKSFASTKKHIIRLGLKDEEHPIRTSKLRCKCAVILIEQLWQIAEMP
jgi:hypothetical protein